MNSLVSLFNQYLSKDNNVKFTFSFIDADFNQGEELFNLLNDKHKADIEFDQLVIVRNGNKCREILYADGSKSTKYYEIKKNGADKITNKSIFRYSANIDTHEKIQQFSANESTIITLHNRAIFTCEELDNWKLIISVFHSITGNENRNIQKYVDEIIKIPFSKLIAEHNYKLSINLVNNSRENMHLASINKILSFMMTILSSGKNIQDIEYNRLLKIVAKNITQKLFHNLTLKSLLPPVRSVSKEEYKQLFPPENYHITIKADGVRALVAVTEDQECYIFADKLYKFGNAKTTNEQIYFTHICDSELITTKSNEMNIYVFDVMKIGGRNVDQEGFNSRINYINDVVADVNKFVPTFAKLFRKLCTNNLKEDFDDIYHNTSYPFEQDGIILIKSDQKYMQTLSYKFKEIKHQTVDLLCKQVGQCEYLLFSTMSKNEVQNTHIIYPAGYQKMFPKLNKWIKMPVLFSPSFSPNAYKLTLPKKSKWSKIIDGKVIELRINKITNGPLDWIITRIRDDRDREVESGTYFGNAMQTAESVLLSYLDPLSYEMLHEGVSADDNYFAAHKKTEYRAMTNSVNDLKKQRTDSLSGFVIDIATGQGGRDIFNYLGSKSITSILAIEQDKAAIVELIRRKYVHLGRNRNSKSPKLITFQANMNEPFNELISDITRKIEIKLNSADAIICNLAFHYFLNSEAHLFNIYSFIDSYSKPGTLVSLLIMDGQKIHNTFIDQKIEQGEYWNSGNISSGSTRYSIHRLYSENTFETTGQKIGVLLPFSDNEYYEENLVNIDAVKEMFSKSFEFVETKTPNMLNSSLTPSDIDWLSFFCELVFRRL